MPFAINVRRSQPPAAPVDRAAFLGERRLCQVMAELVAGDSSRQPWLTPIVGSGRTTSPALEGALLDVAFKLGEKKSRLPELERVAGDPTGEIVRSFALDLVCDRLRLNTVGSRGKSDADPPGDWVFDVCLAAALLARLYFNIKALGYTAPRRIGHDDEAVLPLEGIGRTLLLEDVIQPCTHAIKFMQQQIDGICEAICPDDTYRHRFCKAMTRLTQDIVQELNATPLVVSWGNVQGLSEIGWYCLTSAIKTPYCKGWSDLLLELSHCDAEATPIGFPMFDEMTRAQTVISARLDSGASTGSGGRSLHETVAGLIIEQFNFRKKVGQPRPPAAVAFVTSFDLELEIALIKRNQAFTVLMPVHVLNSLHGLVHIGWVGIAVEADEDAEKGLQGLRAPEPGKCAALERDGIHEMHERGPIVVRLAGCPLVKLPVLSLAGSESLRENLVKRYESYLTMDAGGDSAAMQRIIAGLQLVPAVVLNEHDAVLQNAIDHVATPDQGCYGLPEELIGDGRGWSRYWMLMGVQIHDLAVRQRLTALLTSLPFRTFDSGAHEGTGTQEERSLDEGSETRRMREKRIGVAINRHSTPLERDLLYWSRLDVVTADVGEFVDDLLHYAKHLGGAPHRPGAGPVAMFSVGGECHVD